MDLRELELLLRELRFLQTLDALAQTRFERPEEMKREPDSQAERAGDGKGDAEVARGKDNPGEARALRDERGNPPAERASEEEDDRGRERARNAAPMDWLAHESEQRVAADHNRDSGQRSVSSQTPAEELRPCEENQKDDSDADEPGEEGLAKILRRPEARSRTSLGRGRHAVSYGGDGCRGHGSEQRNPRSA